LEQYLHAQFGQVEHLSPLPPSTMQQLPLLYRSGYRFFAGHLGQHPVVWAEVLNPDDAKPTHLQKQLALLKQHFQQRVILALGTLDSWLRRRLIALQLPFVHPPTHLFVPEFLLELNDSPRSIARRQAPVTLLGAPAQTALIHHLLRRRLDNLSLQDIAQLLQYSAMTTTRVARELASAQLAHVIGSRGKHIQFVAHGRSLWEQALPYLQSPVKETWYCDVEPCATDFFQAGESALAAKTMLADPEVPCYAIGKEHFAALKAQGMLPELDARRGDYCIQVWRYDPALHAAGGIVDPLSLWISLSGNEDERIEMAADAMLRDIPWSQV
jgi:hypothetical protein